MKGDSSLPNNGVLTFLAESNRIEDVHDEESLLRALMAWQFAIEQPSLSEGDLMIIHGWLMAKHLPTGEWGHYRKIQVYVGDHTPPKPELVPIAMREWIDELNCLGTDPRQHHIVFERIHPFVDGNGRIGRILYNWQRIRRGEGVHTIFYSDRHKYYDWFAPKDTTPLPPNPTNNEK